MEIKKKCLNRTHCLKPTDKQHFSNRIPITARLRTWLGILHSHLTPQPTIINGIYFDLLIYT